VTLIAFDTATPATVALVRRADGRDVEARHDPAPDERPGHATRLLALLDDALTRAGLELGDVARIGVGTGPGSFTGLRIGVATARGLAQALDAPLVALSTLRALAAGARDEAGARRPVLAVIDARRGEAFAAAYGDGDMVLEPAALHPDALAAAIDGLPAAPLAVGDGAVRFRPYLDAAGAAIPADESPLHRLAGRHLGDLAAAADPTPRDPVLPYYLRPPDAHRRRSSRP
jgi:tRNA threonylcarbamoyladenosine biosynthesis protein TsaB